MLSSSNRLTSPVHFREVVRRGRRRGGQLMVVHLRVPTTPAPDPTTPDRTSRDGATPPGPRVGFVVSRGVGPAVTRNRVKRRLRHLSRDRLAALPPGSMLVVRALPSAANASFEDLAHELDRCLAEVGVDADIPAKAVIDR